MPQQRPDLVPGEVHGLRSKRQPLGRREAMAPTNLFFDMPPGSVAVDSIAPGAVTGDVIDANTITAGNIMAGSITAGAIAAGSITGDKIAANTITAANIAAGTITATQIAANTITAGNIAAATITSTQIAASTITAGNIAAATITATQLAANSVTATQIAAGAVTATKISVSQLSAITADMGSITAGTITGGLIQTAAGNPHVKLDASGIEMTDPSGTVTFRASSATGVLTLGSPSGSRFQFDPALLSGQRLYLEGQLVGTGTIMGPSFVTSLSNPRVVMDSSGINAYPASSFPTTAVLDDFNRANVGPPPSELWDTTVSGNFLDVRYAGAPGLRVVSNAAKAATDVETSMRWSAVLSSNDNEAYCTVTTTAESVELWARHEGRSAVNGSAPWGYVLFWSGALQNARLQKYGPGGVAGYVDLTAGTAIPGGPVTGMKLGIRCLGTAITGWYKKPAGVWTQFLSVTDATFASGPQVALIVYKAAQIIDDFGGGAYVSAGVAGPSFTLDSQTGTVSMVGGTLTAAAIQTATANPRVVFNASGITAFLADGTVPFKLDGSTGALTITQATIAASAVAGSGQLTFDFKGVTGTTRRLLSLSTNYYGGGQERYWLKATDAAAVSEWAQGSFTRQVAVVADTLPYTIYSQDVGAIGAYTAVSGPNTIAGLFTGNTPVMAELKHQVIVSGVKSSVHVESGLAQLRSGPSTTQFSSVDLGTSSGVMKVVAADGRTNSVILDDAHAELRFDPTSVVTAAYTRAWFATDVAQVLRQESAGLLGYLNITSGQIMLRETISGSLDKRIILDASGFQAFLNVGNTLGMRIHPTTGPSYVTVAAGTSFVIGTGLGGGSTPVTFRDGDQIMLTGVVWQQKVAFQQEFGFKATVAAASTAVGGYVQYTLPAGTAAAVARTPGAFTVATPFLQANNSAQLVNTIRSQGCQFTFTAVAAGQAYCYAGVTAS